ncbi:hypothetical protein ACQCT3_00920 [Sutcliffiella horikoshii]
MEFQNSSLSDNFPASILDHIDEFIRSEISNGYQYLNPYKFAHEYRISDEESLKIFLTFTDEDKLFFIDTFVDCFNCTGKKLKVSTDEVKEEGFVICEDCNNEYKVNQLKKHIYLYFKLNSDIELPKKQYIDTFDPHSTYEIMNKFNSSLKAESPSSFLDSKNEFTTIDTEGEYKKAASLDDIINNNKDSRGQIISKSTLELSESLMELLMTEEAS